MVVEHDEDTIRRADHIIDIGPAPANAAAAWRPRATRDRSLAARRFGHRPLPGATRCGIRCTARRAVVIGRRRRRSVRGATLHNLALDVPVPLKRLVAVTGRERLRQSHAGATLLANLVRSPSNAWSGARSDQLAGCAAIDGWQQIDRVLEVDQTPIGKTPRSCPPPTSASGT